MPGKVQELFAYAIFLAQSRKRHKEAKPLSWGVMVSVPSVVEDWHEGGYHAVYTVRFAMCVYVLRCVQKHGNTGIAAPHPDHGLVRVQYAAAEAHAEGVGSRTEFEAGSTNAYSDLGRPDADELLVKAQLATRIGEVIRERALTHAAAADLAGLPEPKLSGLLRGRFRDVTEGTMMQCLARLGQDVLIVVGPARQEAGAGQVEVISG